MAERAPVVGISAGRGDMPITEGMLPSHYVGRGYIRAVAEAGGVPVVLPSPSGHEDRVATAALDLIDAVVLSGGNDIAPESYGRTDVEVDEVDPSRDRFEIALVQGALERQLPILGVCRGMELINVAYGGTLRSGVRHTEAESLELPGLRDARVHRIRLAPGSRVAAALGQNEVEAICMHHQATDRIGDGLVVTGMAADETAEVIEDPERWVLGVLWHPEQALDQTPVQRRLYEALIRVARGVHA